MILKERWAKLAGLPLNEQELDQDLVNSIVKFLNVLQDEIGDKREGFILSVKAGGPIFGIIKGIVSAAQAGVKAAKNKASESSDRDPLMEVGERANWLKLIGGGTMATLKRLGKEIALSTVSKSEFQEALEAAGKKVSPPLSENEKTHILNLVDKFVP